MMNRLILGRVSRKSEFLESVPIELSDAYSNIR